VAVFGDALVKMGVDAHVANIEARAKICRFQTKLYSNGSSISVIFDTVASFVFGAT
jgi:hypothetical protein